MNYILFIIITSGSKVAIQSQNFKTEIGCLQAIEKIVASEKKLYITANAFCIKD